jgi:hypothetical protein
MGKNRLLCFRLREMILQVLPYSLLELEIRLVSRRNRDLIILFFNLLTSCYKPHSTTRP